MALSNVLIKRKPLWTPTNGKPLEYMVDGIYPCCSITDHTAEYIKEFRKVVCNDISRIEAIEDVESTYCPDMKGCKTYRIEKCPTPQIYKWLKEHCPATTNVNVMIAYYHEHHKTLIQKKRRKNADTLQDWLQHATSVIAYLKAMYPDMTYKQVAGHVNVEPLRSWIQFSLCLDGFIDNVENPFYETAAALTPGQRQQIWDCYFGNDKFGIQRFYYMLGWRVRQVSSYTKFS